MNKKIERIIKRKRNREHKEKHAGRKIKRK
jgi:hypothetical protein